MPLEYELKYVLKDEQLEAELNTLALKNSNYSLILIEQHYLTSPARVRKTTTIIKDKNRYTNGEDIIYMFAYKPKVNKSVIEIETVIDEDDFRLLLPETKKSLLKVRFQEKEPANDEHWIVDFFKSRGETYFVQAECELYGKIKKPKRIPEFIKNNIIFEAKHGDSTFSSRSLCDVTKASELYEKILRGGSCLKKQ